MSPQRWANDITIVLRTVFGADRFPVSVKDVAKEFSRQRYPDDPITVIRGDRLPGFEGALIPAPSGKKGWGIFYNEAVRSTGRINFTLGHEFGHYLLHRATYPRGFQCSSEDMASWDSEYGQLEQQANAFAASLLMPLDDFRYQVNPRDRPSLDHLGACADRYGVSLIATTLRWLQFTERCSMLVISREGFILWSSSSESALKSGLYYKTRNQPPVEIPSLSLPAQQSLNVGQTDEAEHDHDVWLSRPCKEYAFLSEQYDFAISVLHFNDPGYRHVLREELQRSTCEQIVNRTPRQLSLL